MNLIINDDGTTIKAKDWISIDYRLGIDDTPLGDNYSFIALKNGQDIVKLLDKYDDEVKVYFYNNILFITFNDEPYHYSILMADKVFDPIKKQMQNEKKILFAILDNNNDLEYYYSYNII